MAAPLSLLLLLAIAFISRTSERLNAKNNFISLAVTCKLTKPNFYDKSPSKRNNYNGLLLLLILLSNDIETNPGPCNKIYQCGLCDAPVNWSDEGVCCDNCSLWHHASCMGLGASDYKHLNKSSVSWKCFKCNTTNLDSFTFHSYSLNDVSSNYYFPLSDASVDSNSLPTSSWSSPNLSKSPRLSNSKSPHPKNTKPFSPLKTSTPESKTQSKSTSTLGTLNPEALFNTTHSTPP